MKTQVLAAVVAAALVACHAQTPPSDVMPASQPTSMVTIGGIEWHTDYDVAQADAVRRDKPLLLHFGENPG